MTRGAEAVRRLMSLPDERYPSDRDIAAAVLDAVSRPPLLLKEPPRVIADPKLPHQIVLNLTTPGGHIAVSCNCRVIKWGGWKPIAVQRLWKPGEAVAVYKQWHKNRGIDL